MCGRLNVTDDPFMKALTRGLGVVNTTIPERNDVAPGAMLSMIKADDVGRHVHEAVWWLLLDRQTLKPNYKYASFNSRSDKLYQSRSLSYAPFRTGRCVIPASGFVEGFGDKKTYFHLCPQASAIAFGGLYRSWLHPKTGESVYSASIITLPPHPKLKSVHPKSLPLMLPWYDEVLMDQWLDPGRTETSVFETLMQPHLNQSFQVTPIDRPSQRKPIADAFMIERDAA